MSTPSGPIALLCARSPSGNIDICKLNADGELAVDIGLSLSFDAANITYTPAILADWDGGVDPGNQDGANNQLAERVKSLEGLDLINIYPIRGISFHGESFVITGNPCLIAAEASQIFTHYGYQNPPANGDVFSFSFFLRSGSYTLKIYGVTTPSSGKADITFKEQNSSSFVSLSAGMDFYSAAVTYFVSKTATFTITTSGLCTFRFTVNGKNVSSSNYYLFITAFMCYLTAGDS